ncbi:hypothetical protein DFH94DRAFT_698806 [Russula ochroleuca]|uniref:Uncharacterized protein n=1 Tax=Russula ochroleuca TaxID=152965 RepID=A0A9P5MKS9_9AGAM|nr:hypothetical protein DFH94DRAFT_698806 [Russula ochroleuca]
MGGRGDGSADAGGISWRMFAKDGELSYSDILARSPPLPLVIDYFDKSYDINAEDEEGSSIFALKRDRVRRVRLRMLASNLQKFIMAIDEEYPVLEYLIMGPRVEDNSSILILPETFQAPHLRHLVLKFR